MEELLSPTVVVSECEQSALDRFREIYGQSSFACRHSLCERSAERFLTTDERGKHEQSHFKRWRCDDPKCPFFVKGLTSPQALKSHNQKHHITAIPVVSTSNTSQSKIGIVHAGTGSRENTIPAKKISSAQLTRCGGTLPSGRVWGCGGSFVDSTALRAHWLSPSGLKCKDTLRKELSLPSSITASTATVVSDLSGEVPLPNPIVGIPTFIVADIFATRNAKRVGDLVVGREVAYKLPRTSGIGLQLIQCKKIIHVAEFQGERYASKFTLSRKGDDRANVDELRFYEVQDTDGSGKVYRANADSLLALPAYLLGYYKWYTR